MLESLIRLEVGGTGFDQSCELLGNYQLATASCWTHLSMLPYLPGCLEVNEDVVEERYQIRDDILFHGL
jgi:hypothetical protein